MFFLVICLQAVDECYKTCNYVCFLCLILTLLGTEGHLVIKLSDMTDGDGLVFLLLHI